MGKSKKGRNKRLTRPPLGTVSSQSFLMRLAFGKLGSGPKRVVPGKPPWVFNGVRRLPFLGRDLSAWEGFVNRPRGPRRGNGPAFNPTLIKYCGFLPVIDGPRFLAP